jgi:hypothetical protein
MTSDFVSLADFKDASTDAMPLIPEGMEKSTVRPMQTLPAKHEEDEGELDTVIQDYIDQVAASNLKRRRGNLKGEFSDLEVAIPGSQFFSPRGRTVRFSPVTSADHRSNPRKVSPEAEAEQSEVEAMVLMSHSDIENQKGQTSRKQLDHAEKLLRLAFVEFYRGLGLLSHYRFAAESNLSAVGALPT